MDIQAIMRFKCSTLIRDGGGTAWPLRLDGVADELNEDPTHNRAAITKKCCYGNEADSE